VKTNEELLDHLFVTSQIDLKRSNLFDTAPRRLSTVNFDRVEGMMLGLAVGDALGITTESMLPDSRQQKYGEIRDYLPNRSQGVTRGLIS